MSGNIYYKMFRSYLSSGLLIHIFNFLAFFCEKLSFHNNKKQSLKQWKKKVVFYLSKPTHVKKNIVTAAFQLFCLLILLVKNLRYKHINFIPCWDKGFALHFPGGMSAACFSECLRAIAIKWIYCLLISLSEHWGIGNLQKCKIQS